MEKRTIAKIVLGVSVVLLIIVSTFLVSAFKTKKSEEEAAMLAAKITGATVTSVGHGTDNGKEVYYIETEEENKETEVEIDATTGDVLSIEVETDEEDEIKVSSDNAKITEEEAKEIAVAEVGGVVTDMDTDRKNGRDVWEVEIKKSGEYADVLVDMQTGEILAIEWEDGEEEDD